MEIIDKIILNIYSLIILIESIIVILLIFGWAKIEAIIYIIKADSKKIFSFELSEAFRKELELIANIYLNEKLEKEYKLEKLF